MCKQQEVSEFELPLMNGMFWAVSDKPKTNLTYSLNRI